VALDAHNWDPLGADALAEVFRDIPVQWWIAGGCALDLFLGTSTRPHQDIDVLILRRDQLTVQEHLRDWELFKTQQPTPSCLAPWPQGEFLEPPINSIWVRRPRTAPWSFEIMLLEAEGDQWIYRRLPSIRGKISDIGLRTSDGVPYLAPEIQLLYKSGTGRQKDIGDLANVLPKLPWERAQWLLECLRVQYPIGHAWIEHIERALKDRR
jgi:hypothetical protein